MIDTHINQVLTIARFTVLEAVRTRLPWIALAILALLFLSSLFVQHIAVTESARMQTGFLAAAVRFASVIVLSLHVAGSMVREFNDKNVDLLLSLDLPRAGFYLGKFLGFAAIAVGLASLATLTLLAAGPGIGLAWWGISLALELILVASLALFCVITFAQVMPAISFVLAFYLLARSISAVRLLSASPLVAADSWTNRTVAAFADALAWCLPNLDRFTATTWLVDGGGASALGFIALQSFVYASLLVLAGLFDLYRKNL